ncbi:MAG: two pore domain potassium channel family protein [Epulopiscium sp.]|nr:two pore domain potassium channel family protein [Candidatus Epulonipiscium sp.]
MRRKTMMIYNILFLCFLYISVASIFSLMYIVSDFLNLGCIIDHYSSSLHQHQFLDLFTRSFYFSITTLFSVGYGDLTPFGISKGIAIIESLIGYVLPYAIVINYILYNPKFFRKNLHK